HTKLYLKLKKCYHKLYGLLVKSAVLNKIEDRLVKLNYLFEFDKFKNNNIASVLADIFSQYKYIWEIRGDGNCFYRALCFGHLESLLQKDRNSFKYLLNMVNVHVSTVVLFSKIKYCIFTIITFVGVLEQCEADEHGDTLLQLFNEQTTFDSMVQYLRLLTLAYLQNHADFFSHFVEAPIGKSVKNKCLFTMREVETMAMECDHIDILALSEALGVSIHIASIEGETDSPSLHLLYKTAHYDILYPHHCH
uniref:ubiquitinyl hydrolase 1 n=1 Tax=Oncorhynchus kisutch TaxID=8019 RepID=A0A8C7DGP0_ONCKI